MRPISIVAISGARASKAPTFPVNVLADVARAFTQTVPAYDGSLVSVPNNKPAVTGGRLDGAAMVDTLADGTPLQPSMLVGTPSGPAKVYNTYTAVTRNTAYTVGQRVSAVASDNIERWYHCTTGGTTAGSAPTFPVSGTVVDGGVTWTYGGYHTIKGVLVEPGATNIQLWSKDLTNAAWTQSGVSVTPAAGVSVFGDNLAQKVVPSNVATTFKELQQNFTSVTGTNYTYSVILKADGYRYIQLLGTGAQFGGFSINFDLVNGVETRYDSTGATINGRGIIKCGNGYWLLWVSVLCNAGASVSRLGFNVVPAADSIRGVSWAGDGSAGVLFSCSQLETGTTPTSYIPTTTATETRVATNLDMTIPARATDFTVVVRAIWGNAATAANIALASCGTDSNNRWELKRNAAGTGWEVERSVAGSVTQSTSLAHALTQGQPYVVVMRVSSTTGLTLFADAVSVTDASWTSLPTGTAIKVGRRFGDTAYRIGANLCSMIGRAISSTQAQELINGTKQVYQVR